MLARGTTLGHYEIRDLVGAGGMGRVYRAWDRRLEREVAVKVLPERLLTDPVARQRFEREAKAIAALHHPNILTIHDFGEEGQVAYAVMELLEGKSLREELAETGPVDPATAVRIAAAAARGLAEAHARGVVHRDVKPGNLFLGSSGEVKVLDFGLARSVEVEGPRSPDAVTLAEGPTVAGTVLGTMGYMSPEQARGETATTASDVFALGCVLHEMLSGSRPFERKTDIETLAAVLSDDPPPLAEPSTGALAGLDRVVAKALAKDPHDRYPTAGEMAAALDGIAERLSGGSRRRRLPWLAAAAVVLLAVAAGLFLLLGDSEGDWARNEALPELLRLAEAEEYWDAFLLARRIQEVLPDDPLLTETLDEITVAGPLETDPPGIEVSIRPYVPGAEWLVLGTTPFTELRLPAGAYRYRVRKDGYVPEELGAPSEFVYLRLGGAPLHPEGSLPAGMELVQGARSALLGLQQVNPVSYSFSSFLLGRYEVTNREFQAFVDAGGYQDPSYWRHELRDDDGRTLSFEEAMERFRDSTGRPGPATWEVGRFPSGQEDYPVSGVSWYEAAAYAAYADASLPTIFHWNRPAFVSMAPWVLRLSNVESDGSAPVGSFEGVTIGGTFDMAGNVREWCLNPSGERRFILGGGWSEPGYAFFIANTLPPMDRSPLNGLRIMRYLDPATGEREDLAREHGWVTRDLDHIEVAGDEVVGLWQAMTAYDPVPLDPQPAALPEDITRWSSVSSGEPPWTAERVSYRTAYGGERMSTLLFLPHGVEPPFQPVLVFPGQSAMTRRRIEEGAGLFRSIEFLVQSGRALVLPVLKSTYDRGDGLLTSGPQPGRGKEWQDHVVMWIQDVQRTLDYLESRDDMDLDSLSYLGISWGGWMSVYLLPVEERIDVALLWSGGVGIAGPDITAPDTVLGRYPGMGFRLLQEVRDPVLMLNGKYDFIFPVELSQEPLFRFLGTPPDQKRHVVFEEGAHYPLPRRKVIRETLDFLDRHLPPVKRSD